jgi:hypothetical protein
LVTKWYKNGKREVTKLGRHAVTRFRTPLTRIGAGLAVVSIVLSALGRAVFAYLRTQSAHFMNVAFMPHIA